MNKAVLISIRPKWCELIASGKKTVEIRKNAPNLPTPFKCYIYCTKARSAAEVLTPCNNLSDVRNGKVLGEFFCDAIWMLAPVCRAPYDIDVESQSKLTTEEIVDYLRGKGYGWHISNLVIYDDPKELREFYRWWDDGDDIRPCQNGKKCDFEYFDYAENCVACCVDFDGTDCPFLKVNRPPQSWMYVEPLGGDA